MDRIPAANGTFDLVIAHGIWNLAQTGAEFRRAVHEAPRVAAAGATLFVFTFSRTTLERALLPVAGERFVFTAFSGQPQCFVTAAQLEEELGIAGFRRHPGEPLLELNRPSPRDVPTRAIPVIHEGVFRLEP